MRQHSSWHNSESAVDAGLNDHKGINAPPLGICVFSTADARENEDKCHYQPHNESDNCAERDMIHAILRASDYAKPQPYALCAHARISRILIGAILAALPLAAFAAEECRPFCAVAGCCLFC
jgi:hypothetical protein